MVLVVITIMIMTSAGGVQLYNSLKYLEGLFRPLRIQTVSCAGFNGVESTKQQKTYSGLRCTSCTEVQSTIGNRLLNMS